MKYYLRLGLILLIITAIASGILAFINSFTQPMIEENRRRTEEEARREVMPQAVKFELAEDDFLFYIGRDEEDNIVGYTFIATEYGYSSDIQTMVGLNADKTINKIKIISQSETPGLGANCTDPEFQELFDGLKKEEVAIDKDGGKIETITGATITSRAITNSIQKAIDKLESSLSGNSPKGARS
jgi:electron transport complex protein RnfG